MRGWEGGGGIEMRDCTNDEGSGTLLSCFLVVRLSFKILLLHAGRLLLHSEKVAVRIKRFSFRVNVFATNKTKRELRSCIN
jgi:hypothetical protein